MIVWAKGSIQSGLAPVGAGGRHADSIISVTRPKKGIGLVEILDRVTMQVLVRGDCDGRRTNVTLMEYRRGRISQRRSSGGDRTRTGGLYVANVALYQLSYTPAEAGSVPARFPSVCAQCQGQVADE